MAEIIKRITQEQENIIVEIEDTETRETRRYLFRTKDIQSNEDLKEKLRYARGCEKLNAEKAKKKIAEAKRIEGEML